MPATTEMIALEAMILGRSVPSTNSTYRIQFASKHNT